MRKVLHFVQNALWCVLVLMFLYLLAVGAMAIYIRYFMKIEVAG